MRTSHKKHRPFDFKLIDLVEPNEVLYKRHTGLSNYELMKVKTEIWRKIASEMDSEVRFCVMRWNNLRYQFRKELRRETELCPKLGIMRTSTWPYLERLIFLKDINPVKPKSGLKNENELYNKKDSPLKTCWDDYSGDDWELESAILKENDTKQLAQQQQTNDTQLMKDEISNTDFIMIEEIIETNCNEEIIETNCNEEIIEEEIIYENSEEEREEEECKPMYSSSSGNSTLTDGHLQESTTTTNMQQMEILLQCMQGTEREEAEKRILAFALKCQLRALMNQNTDDLII